MWTIHRQAGRNGGDASLVSGSNDGTALVWDLAGVLPPEKAFDGAALWDDLKSTNRMQAYKAFCRLLAAPKEAVALLKDEFGKTDGPQESLRREWAIRLLEHLDAADSRALLETLSRGDAASSVATEAQASLKRLSERARPR